MLRRRQRRLCNFATFHSTHRTNKNNNAAQRATVIREEKKETNRLCDEPATQRQKRSFPRKYYSHPVRHVAVLSSRLSDILEPCRAAATQTIADAAVRTDRVSAGRGGAGGGTRSIVSAAKETVLLWHQKVNSTCLLPSKENTAHQKQQPVKNKRREFEGIRNASLTHIMRSVRGGGGGGGTQVTVAAAAASGSRSSPTDSIRGNGSRQFANVTSNNMYPGIEGITGSNSWSVALSLLAGSFAADREILKRREQQEQRRRASALSPDDDAHCFSHTPWFCEWVISTLGARRRNSSSSSSSSLWHETLDIYAQIVREVDHLYATPVAQPLLHEKQRYLQQQQQQRRAKRELKSAMSLRLLLTLDKSISSTAESNNNNNDTDDHRTQEFVQFFVRDGKQLTGIHSAILPQHQAKLLRLSMFRRRTEYTQVKREEDVGEEDEKNTASQHSCCWDVALGIAAAHVACGLRIDTCTVDLCHVLCRGGQRERALQIMKLLRRRQQQPKGAVAPVDLIGVLRSPELSSCESIFARCFFAGAGQKGGATISEVEKRSLSSSSLPGVVAPISARELNMRMKSLVADSEVQQQQEEEDENDAGEEGGAQPAAAIGTTTTTHSKLGWRRAAEVYFQCYSSHKNSKRTTLAAAAAAGDRCVEFDWLCASYLLRCVANGYRFCNDRATSRKQRDFFRQQKQIHQQQQPMNNADACNIDEEHWVMCLRVFCYCASQTRDSVVVAGSGAKKELKSPSRVLLLRELNEGLLKRCNAPAYLTGVWVKSVQVLSSILSQEHDAEEVKNQRITSLVSQTQQATTEAAKESVAASLLGFLLRQNQQWQLALQIYNSLKTTHPTNSFQPLGSALVNDDGTAIPTATRIERCTARAPLVPFEAQKTASLDRHLLEVYAQLALYTKQLQELLHDPAHEGGADKQEGKNSGDWDLSELSQVVKDSSYRDDSLLFGFLEDDDSSRPSPAPTSTSPPSFSSPWEHAMWLYARQVSALPIQRDLRKLQQRALTHDSRRSAPAAAAGFQRQQQNNNNDVSSNQNHQQKHPYISLCEDHSSGTVGGANNSSVFGSSDFSHRCEDSSAQSNIRSIARHVLARTLLELQSEKKRTFEGGVGNDNSIRSSSSNSSTSPITRSNEYVERALSALLE